MDRWLESCAHVLNHTKLSDDKEIAFADQMRKIDFSAEVAWLKSIIESSNFDVVFSHNDLQEGNILFRDSSASRNGTMDRLW